MEVEDLMGDVKLIIRRMNRMIIVTMTCRESCVLMTMMIMMKIIRMMRNLLGGRVSLSRSNLRIPCSCDVRRSS